jgi:Histidine kinase-, DNA gyrase B-, and HSP90-like ATPase
MVGHDHLVHRTNLASRAHQAVGTRSACYALTAIALGLVPFVVAADDRSGLSSSATAWDVALGLALVASGLLGLRPRQDAWVSLVGVSWLLGSVLGSTATLNRGVLLLCLLAFPSGQLTSRWGWWPYAAASVVALPPCPQAVASVAFFGAAWLLTLDRPLRPAQPFPGMLAAAAGAFQALGATTALIGARELIPVAANGYSSTLLALALGHPWASRIAARRVTDSAARWGDDHADSLYDPFGRVGELLGDVLGDPNLQVTPWSESTAWVSPADPAQPVGGAHAVVVHDGGHHLAVIHGSTSALDDPQTARSASEAVRLVVQHTELLAQERERLAQVSASRSRLVDVEDRERAALRVLLQTHVILPVSRLHSSLSPLATSPEVGEAHATVELVLEELDATVLEMDALLKGLPPGDLGDGRLVAALTELARRSPVPLEVSVDSHATGDAGAETMIYAFCAEAVTNALKHANADRIWCEVKLDDEELVARVRDDGTGDADPGGSGLQGLRDRLAARGGRLRLDSPPGVGTTVEARVPPRFDSPG